MPTNLQARYDLFCVKSAVKPQPTNQPTCGCHAEASSGNLQHIRQGQPQQMVHWGVSCNEYSELVFLCNDTDWHEIQAKTSIGVLCWTVIEESRKLSFKGVILHQNQGRGTRHGVYKNYNCFVMAALRSRCGHYIFALWFLLSSFSLAYFHPSQIGCLPYFVLHIVWP